MPGHSSSACQNLGAGTEDLTILAPVKRAYVSPSGPSKDAAEVRSDSSPSPGDSCPITGAATGNREADRRRKKTKLPPWDATSDLPVMSSPSNIITIHEDSSGTDSFGNEKTGNEPSDPLSGKSKGRYMSKSTGLLIQDTPLILYGTALGESAGKRLGKSCLRTAGQPPGPSPNCCR